MADEAAAPVVETTAAPVEAAPAPAAGGDESFSAAMQRLGGEKVFDGPLTPEGDAPAEPAKAPKRGKKPEVATEAAAEADGAPEIPVSPEAKTAAATNEAEQLKALAQKLGFQLEDGRVTTTERVKLREERREQAQRVARLEQEAMERINAREKELTPSLDRATAIEAAAKAGDYQAIAKSLGFESWDKLQEDQIAKAADPHYRRIQELEEREQQREAADRQRQEQMQLQEQQRARAQAETQYRQGLAADLSKSQDPLLRELHDDPGFVGAIFNLQKQHWDPATQETLQPERAVDFAPPGGISLRAHMQKLHEKLGKALGQPTASSPAAAPVTNTTKKPAPKTEAPAPLTPSKPARNVRDDDWMKNASARLRQAAHEEEQARRRGERV